MEFLTKKSCCRSFFGFPVELSFDRGGPYQNYADIELFFFDGYTPHGCHIHKVTETIKNLFKIKKVEIFAENGVNKRIKFKFPCSFYSKISDKKNLVDGYELGAAGILLDLIIMNFK